MGRCCCQCTFKTDDFSEPYEVVRELLAASEGGYSVTVVSDDGTTLNCRARETTNKTPCLEISRKAIYHNLHDPEQLPPLQANWGAGDRVLVFPSGWTWTPDGQFHQFTVKVDGAARANSMHFIPGTGTDHDWDIDDAGPIPGFWGAPAPVICVRQAGQIYFHFVVDMSELGSVLLLHDGSEFIPGDPNDMQTGFWQRTVSVGKSHARCAIWSGVPGVDYGLYGLPEWEWWRSIRPDEYLTPAPDSEFSLVAWTIERGHPDNTPGSGDWEIGFGLDFGVSQQPHITAFTGFTGGPFVDASTRSRIDSVCIAIDPRDY